MALQDEIYKEVGANYRFFLGWRHATLGGYVVVVGAVFTLLFSVPRDARDFAWIAPLASAFLGPILWIIDRRTRDLYHAAIRAGKELESEAGGKGVYTQIGQLVRPHDQQCMCRASHSMGLSLIFWGGTLALLVVAAWLYLHPGPVETPSAAPGATAPARPASSPR